jgi:Domain of unknown function (DUF5666)
VNRGLRLFLSLAFFAVLGAAITPAQDEPAGPQQQQPGQGQGRGGREGGRPAVFGKITAVRDGSIEVTNQDGQAVTVKLTPQTEFRKDRQPAKAADFKVGDMVMVRGNKNADNTVTASMVGGRTGGGPGGGGGNGGRPSGAMNLGTLGKDYVAGEVKSIDAPKLTVVRSDGVTQILELNEDTSLRSGRASITMADIKVGDHIMVRGAAQNDAFVPKSLMVMNPEQWQRMQEMMSSEAQGKASKSNSPEATAPKPQE